MKKLIAGPNYKKVDYTFPQKDFFGNTAKESRPGTDSDAFFRQIAVNTKEAVLAIDPFNRILNFNQAFGSLFGRIAGITKETVIEKMLEKLRPYMLKDIGNDIILDLLSDPGAADFEGELKIRLTSDRIYHIYIHNILGKASENEGRIIFIKDVTEYKNQIERLERECKVMSKLNEKNETIVSNISEQARSKAEESSRSANYAVKALLELSEELLEIMENSMAYNGKFRKRIENIQDSIRHEMADIGGFITNIDKKQAEMDEVLKKLSLELNSQKMMKVKETGLDEKEILIIQMIASCKTNKDIARDLNYEEETIKNKITVIRRKLKLKDRCHLVSYAFRNGLV